MLSQLANQRGSLTVEATCIAAYLIASITGILVLAYFAFARVWVQRVSYEAIICLSTSTRAYQCEQRMRRQLSSALPIGEIEELSMKRLPKMAVVEAKLMIGSKYLVVHRDARELPLQASRDK